MKEGTLQYNTEDLRVIRVETFFFKTCISERGSDFHITQLKNWVPSFNKLL